MRVHSSSDSLTPRNGVGAQRKKQTVPASKQIHEPWFIANKQVIWWDLVDLGLLKLPDIVKLHTCLLFYDILHDNKPSNLNLSFISEQHNYHTRNASSQRLQICPFRINIRKFCPSVIGTYYWNDIPQSIRNKSSKQLFKYALQQYYFAQYWYLSNLCTCACMCIVLYVCMY